MSSSISFDRAVEYYDETRGYADDGTAERIRDGIMEATGADAASRILELGVGTGRIALPFIALGCDYTGVDLSVGMMLRLQAKLGRLDGPLRYRLCNADVTALPFPDQVFDVVLAVHVLHLVEGWREAIGEARRVLKPGGSFVIARDESTDPHKSMEENSPTRQVHLQWQAIVKDLGFESRRERIGFRDTDSVMEEHLGSLGARTRTADLAEWQAPPITPREAARRLIDRVYSHTWNVPEALHQEAADRLRQWIDARDDVDQPDLRRGRFHAVIATWSQDG